ncbi:hypothetical protein AX15_006182 [Amanita polypyramis BW_CC]|nr:hypothetical protein AX15_006182 [Amanita polypyramis BW_CC]
MANPPDIITYPDTYKQWSKLDNFCRQATQTWYNIQFKELKDATAGALNLDPTTLQEIQKSMEWLTDELEKAGADPAYVAQQATVRAESISSSKQVSRVNMLAIQPSLKICSRSADTVLRSHPSTPENKGLIDIKTHTPKHIQEKLQSVVSDITSLEYIDEPQVKVEEVEPKINSPNDVEMTENIIINQAIIQHRVIMDLVAEPSKTEANLTQEDQVQFHKELVTKKYSARSAYLEVMLETLFKDTTNLDLHQGHYQNIKDIYNNFNNPLEKFEDQIESIEKDRSLFAILPYKLYGNLLVHWLVTRKHIQNAMNITMDGSMEKVAWAHINALFDHCFKDTLSENDFLHIIKGLHQILDELIQNKYDIDNFGKGPSGEKIIYVEKPTETGKASAGSNESQPSLLQQQ